MSLYVFVVLKGLVPALPSKFILYHSLPSPAGSSHLSTPKDANVF